MSNRKRPREVEDTDEEEEWNADEPDPVISFILNPSEQIHQCLALPFSPIPQGNTLQDLYIALATYVHQTVTGLQLYNQARNGVLPGGRVVPPNVNAPPGINRAMFPIHPLVYQRVQPGLEAMVINAFANPQFEQQCHQQTISCGTIVIAGRPTPSSRYITTNLIAVGGFLAYLGI